MIIIIVLPSTYICYHLLSHVNIYGVVVCFIVLMYTVPIVTYICLVALLFNVENNYTYKLADITFGMREH